VKRSITTTELQKYIFCVGERLFYCQGEKDGGLKNEKNNNLIPQFSTRNFGEKTNPLHPLNLELQICIYL
jgi:hypothetical protein